MRDKGFLVYIELRNGGAADVSLELIGKAACLAAKSNEHVYGAAVGAYSSTLAEQLKGTALEKLYLYECGEEFQAAIHGEALTECIRSTKPAVVLIGGTARGRALASRVAVACRTGVTADCTHLEINDADQLVQIRPAFGGNIMASIITAHTRPQIATVRPGIFKIPRANMGKIPEIVRINWNPQKRGARIMKKTTTQSKEGIAQQKVLVVAGRGVMKKEDLNMLRDLARLLGGQLASSRALVEKGWMKPGEQIGLSGLTVSPECMLTFGVSGTVQFMAGMKNTPNIIAVNSDPGARIFEIAHHPICADLYDVVPALIKQLCSNNDDNWSAESL